MKKINLTALLILFMPFLVSAHLSLEPIKTKVIENFSESHPGEFPKHFRTIPFQKGKAKKVYKVMRQEKNKYLVAQDTQDISVQIFRKFYWKLADYPILNWRWRATELPLDANETIPEKNDSACGVYIAFGGYTGDVIKYVWSTTLNPGTVVAKKPGEIYIIVKNKGASDDWQEVSANIYEDYKKVFNREPEKEPIGFGILTDGNATHSPAGCEYDDFMLAVP